MSPYTQVIVVRTDLKMDKGKIAAQSAHAAIAAFLKAQQQSKYREWAEEWLVEGMQKIVVKVASEKELLQLFEQVKGKFPSAIIQDAGHPQIAPGSKPCIGIGPAPEIELR